RDCSTVLFRAHRWRGMRPVALTPAAQRGEIPDNGNRGGETKDRTQGKLDELPWADVKPSPKDVAADGQHDDGRDGEDKRKALLLALVVHTAPEPVFIRVGHGATRLKTRKVPVAIIASDASNRRMGLIRSLPASVLGFSGSSIQRSTLSRIRSPQSAARSSRKRFTIAETCSSFFIARAQMSL